MPQFELLGKCSSTGDSLDGSGYCPLIRKGKYGVHRVCVDSLGEMCWGLLGRVLLSLIRKMSCETATLRITHGQRRMKEAIIALKHVPGRVFVMIAQDEVE
ncbi:hypothetical protein RJT34_13286 [Clitoria ternatea]|uniref:Uncharacterized protein n=1 Tax=Clitoria ternatea TaxID=43366 RepID=A0AAN9JQV9_CLITE